ncbi:MAG: BrnT family toxin [Mariprofundaceae bacterium]|nr:BrnT family toxin [Mariprofundaceae bacterium]
MNYQWHKEKARANVKKHGIRFADAVTALDDDLSLTLEDDAAEGETRYITLGRGDLGSLLVVFGVSPLMIVYG